MLIVSFILHIKWLYPILYNDRFTHPVYNDCFTHRVQWLSRPPCTMAVSPAVYNDCFTHRVPWLFHPPCTMTVLPTVYSDYFTHYVQCLFHPPCFMTVSSTWTMTVSSILNNDCFIQPGAQFPWGSKRFFFQGQPTLYNNCFIHHVQCSFQLPSSSLQPSSSLVCFTCPPCGMLHLSTLRNASPVLSNACMFNPFCPLLTWAYSSDSSSPPPPPPITRIQRVGLFHSKVRHPSFRQSSYAVVSWGTTRSLIPKT